MKRILFILLLSVSVCQAQTFIKPEGKQAHTSGASVAATAGVGILKVNPASLLAALTVTFPTAPSDRDVFIMLYGGTITSGTVVTVLTLAAGGNILGTLPTTALAGTAIAYIYDSSEGKWYRFF